MNSTRIRGDLACWSRSIQSAVSAVLVSTSNLLLLNFAIGMIAPFSGGELSSSDVREQLGNGCAACSSISVVGLVFVSRPVTLFERVSVVRLSLDYYLACDYVWSRNATALMTLAGVSGILFATIHIAIIALPDDRWAQPTNVIIQTVPEVPGTAR